MSEGDKLRALPGVLVRLPHRRLRGHSWGSWFQIPGGPRQALQRQPRQSEGREDQEVGLQCGVPVALGGPCSDVFWVPRAGALLGASPRLSGACTPGSFSAPWA